MLGFCVLWISIGISIWQSSSSAGDMQLVLDKVNGLRKAYGQGELGWDKDFCASAPYMYLSPIKFTFSFLSANYDNAASCSWPKSKTNFRIVLGVLQSLLHVFLLLPRFAFLSSPCASPILLSCAFLWYSAMVLDCQALQSATTACSNNLEKLVSGTLGFDPKYFAVNCRNEGFALVPLIDLILFLLTFVLGRAWSQCPNKYGIVSPDTAGPQSDDAKRPTSTKSDAAAKAAADAAAATAQNRRATGSWWRASENTRLSEIFPRNSVVGGSHKPTQAEMQARGMTAEQYQKYSRIPGCLERIWAMMMAGFGVSSNSDASSSGGSGGSAGATLSRISVNDSFSSSIKGGSANRLNAGEVNSNALAMYGPTPPQRPLSGPRKLEFINTTPPPPKPPKIGSTPPNTASPLSKNAIATGENDSVVSAGAGAGAGAGQVAETANPLNPFGEKDEQVQVSDVSAGIDTALGMSTRGAAVESSSQEMPPPPPSAPPPPLFTLAPKAPKPLPGTPIQIATSPLGVDPSESAPLSDKPNLGNGDIEPALNPFGNSTDE